jgi:hypothetical protein
MFFKLSFCVTGCIIAVTGMMMLFMGTSSSVQGSPYGCSAQLSDLTAQINTLNARLAALNATLSNVNNYITKPNAAKVASANGYQQLTGNTVTLTSGIWLLFGQCTSDAAGGIPDYTSIRCRFFTANGNDNSNAPLGLSGSVQILGGNINGAGAWVPGTTNDRMQFYINQVTNLVQVTATTTLYLVPYFSATNPGYAVPQTDIIAIQIK